MTHYQVTPSTLSGALTPPPSKSHTLRAILFALMAHGTSKIFNYLASPDTEAMIAAIRTLGAQVTITSTCLEIVGTGGKFTPTSHQIDAGNSGQVLRFIGALSALSDQPFKFTGDHSIRTRRPIQPLLDGLQQLGASVKTDPLTICGPIRPGTATLCGLDSQPVSGLLIATSFLPGPSQLHVLNPGEKPWIALTLHWLERFGIGYTHENFEHYTVFGNARIPSFEISIPSDFSSAAYPIAAALVTGSTLTLEQIDTSDVQGDKIVIPLLEQMGAHIAYEKAEHRLTILPSGPLRGLEIDVNTCIDALPLLAVVACFATTPTLLYNGAIARRKESDRIAAIAAELRKMGARLEEHADGLTIFPSKLQGASLISHSDHRIALSLTVAALGASSPSQIEGFAWIAKSYPDFVSQFQQLGANLEPHSVRI